MQELKKGEENMQELTEFNIENATAKILMLKEQTAQNIIEIGKTLIEVKSKLEYGEFGIWLKNKVEFTHQTANKFMKVATEFPDYAPVRNLGTRKLFVLAGLDEEDRQEVMQENNIEEMTTRELEQVVKEKKEIKKQLEAEQEYSQELQDAIKQKEEQIRALKIQIENTQKPEVQIVEKEIVKEIISEELISKKKALEEEVKTLRERASKAEIALKNVKLESKVEKDNVYYKNNLDLLQVIVKEFLEKASKYTYFREEYQNIPTQKKKFIESNLEQVKNWVMLMEQAINNRQDVVGNIIYGEGEIINE